MGIPLQWDFFEYLPVVLQDATTKDVLMLHSSPTAVISRQDGVSQSIEACVRACRGESAPDEGVEGEPKPWSIRCLRGLLVDLLVYGAPSEDFEAAETACIRRIRHDVIPIARKRS